MARKPKGNAVEGEGAHVCVYEFPAVVTLEGLDDHVVLGADEREEAFEGERGVGLVAERK